MNFTDQGIIINKKSLQESSYILSVFTKSHGIYSGVLTQYTKKMGDNLVPSNLVDFHWNARLHEHLGYAKADLIKSYNSYLMINKTKLYAFNSITSLLQLAFCEREPHNNLFPILLDFLDSMKYEFSFEKYFKLELAILAESGYSLQLDSCAVTGACDNLHYISPKSGRAVSKSVGAPYADKLLLLPKFVANNINQDPQTIQSALKLTTYFFNRYILLDKPLPLARQYFFEHMFKISQ